MITRQWNLMFMYLLIMPICCLSAGGISETEGNRIRVEGRILMKGSMPMVHIVIESEDGKDYILKGDAVAQLVELHRMKRVLIIGYIRSRDDDPPIIDIKRYRVLSD